MIKFLKEKIKMRGWLWLLKNYTKPDKEFSNESRRLFIEQLKKRGVVAPMRADARMLVLRRGLGYGLASLILLSSFTGGIVVYAQKQEIDFNHPLYPIKRFGEAIQVKFAPAKEKPVLQQEFAERRLAEIRQLIWEKEEKIKLINSQKTEEIRQKVETIEKEEQEIKQVAAEGFGSPEIIQRIRQVEEEKQRIVEQIEEIREKEIEKIENENEEKTEELNDDFHETVDSVLKTIDPLEKEFLEQKETENLCDSLRENIREHEEILRENDRWSEFEDKCDEDEKETEMSEDENNEEGDEEENEEKEMSEDENKENDDEGNEGREENEDD